MFAEKPYKDVYVDDIAARAGVSRALFYHYFPTKRDLYVAIFHRASNRFLARVGTDPHLPVAEQLATALEAHIQSFVDHPFEAVMLCSRLKNDSMAALSPAAPTRPVEPTMSWRPRAWTNRRLRNCDPRSL